MSPALSSFSEIIQLHTGACVIDVIIFSFAYLFASNELPTVESQDRLEGTAMKIAAFNVQIFGAKKMRNKMVKDVLVKVGMESNVFYPLCLQRFLCLRIVIANGGSQIFKRGSSEMTEGEGLFGNLSHPLPHFLTWLLSLKHRKIELCILTDLVCLFVFELGYFEVRCNTHSGNPFTERHANQ